MSKYIAYGLHKEERIWRQVRTGDVIETEERDIQEWGWGGQVDFGLRGGQ